VQHGFNLNLGQQVTADDLVSILPYLFVKANVDRLLAHFNFIVAFHIASDEGD
jgi:hypothetical protein